MGRRALRAWNVRQAWQHARSALGPVLCSERAAALSVSLLVRAVQPAPPSAAATGVRRVYCRGSASHRQHTGCSRPTRRRWAAATAPAAAAR